MLGRFAVLRRAPSRVSSGARASLGDDALGVGAIAVPARLDLRLLEVLVDLEEVLDLVAQLGRDVVHVRDPHPCRVLQRHADDLLVRALLVGHVEHADDAPADAAAGERRLADEHERVERIAVAAHRALDEPVVGRIRHRGEQAPVEDDRRRAPCPSSYLFREPDGTSTKTTTSDMA